MADLTPEDIEALGRLVDSAWDRFTRERPAYVTIRDYLLGKKGVPRAPADAEPRLREIAADAVDNVLPLALDALTTPLSVVGFRSRDTEDDLDAWDQWQAETMDARQTDVFRDANAYGRAYGFEDADRFRLGSPLNSYAAYRDESDDFPRYGFTLTLDETGPRVTLGMLFYDSLHRYRLHLASIEHDVYDSTGIDAFVGSTFGVLPTLIDHEEHGFSHPPIFRFGDDRPEITTDIMRRQRSINSSVYNRDVCEEYSAFPQKALIGWDGTEKQKAQAGMTKVMAFADGDVQIQSLTAAELRPFIEAVREKKMALAQALQVSPALLVPSANMAADMIALANAPYGRKLATKQRRFGEDIERWLRARAARDGVEVPDDAETVWDEVTPRSYAAVVDGIVKLASVQDKVTKSLIEDIPGWTSQKVEAFVAESQRFRGTSVLDQLRAAAGEVKGRGDEPGS